MKLTLVGSYALIVCCVAPALSLKQCLSGGPRTFTAPLHARKESGENGIKIQTIGILAGTVGLALGANFLGITSSLLSSTPWAERSVLSELYAINGFRKIVTEDYSFLVPSTWSPDLSVLQKKQRFRELPDELAKKSPLRGLPESAFLGENLVDNFSVIKSIVQPGFEMVKTLGSPSNALQFLSTSLAPEGSGKTIDIVDASEDLDPLGNLRYRFEYIINNPSWSSGPRHTISIVMFQYPKNLYTATLVLPEKSWLIPEVQAQGRKITESFQLLSTPPLSFSKAELNVMASF
jgi:hypothetical protein